MQGMPRFVCVLCAVLVTGWVDRTLGVDEPGCACGRDGFCPAAECVVEKIGESVPLPESYTFLAAEACALCHANSDRAAAMRDREDRPVAPYDLWRSSMMAHAARDPFWRAVLSAEVAATPSQKAHIEETCTRCHAPMAGPAPESPADQVLAYLDAGDERSLLGRDGVSCTVCHQITADGLGTDASFTGRFRINGDRRIFGPHADPFPMPMQHHVNFTPTQGNHVLTSGLCATCHTVVTTSVDAEGTPSAGRFHEQAPYLEWRNSVFNNEREPAPESAQSCQACHMPTTDVDGNRIETVIAHNPGGRDFPFLDAREPFGRHTMAGANTFMARMLRDFADDLDVPTPRVSSTAGLKGNRHFLRNQTANLRLGPIAVEQGTMVIPVAVQNLCGHKLPTAYPSRRAWIQLTVRGPDGETVFDSGRANGDGELVGADGSVLAPEREGGPLFPHAAVINSADQVQVYEAVMADADGNPTFTLLRGAGYAKDNRLLPDGWVRDHADAPATRPYGIDGDADFQGGGDRLVYRVPVRESGSYRVRATLLFQTIAPRHARELFVHQTPEVAAFQEMYRQADRRPERLARVAQRVDVQPVGPRTQTQGK